jgi:hypothetical protein
MVGIVAAYNDLRQSARGLQCPPNGEQPLPETASMSIDVQRGRVLGALGFTVSTAIERARRGRYLTVFATVWRWHVIASMRVA